MKDERNVRHRRAAGGIWRPAAIILAAVIAAVSIPLFGNSVFAASLDVNKTCSLTVSCSASSDKDKELLSEAGVVIDLYRVAYFVEDDTYDTYHWFPTSAFDEGDITFPEDTDRAGWKATTEELTDILLGDLSEQQSVWAPSDAGGLSENFIEWPGETSSDSSSSSTVASSDSIDTGSYKLTGRSLDETITGLPSGFYLIVARGSNVEKYVSVNKADSSDDSSSEGSTSADATADSSYMTKTVTLAKSSRRTYQFATEMVALPAKDANADGEYNTGNAGDWIYDWTEDRTVVLKPAVLGVGGTLQIVKDLDTYEYRKKTTDGKTRDIIDDATFVFEVTAYESEAEGAAQIYHNFVTATFNEGTSKTMLVEDLPVGSYVVVEEVYSGRSYTATVDTKQTTTIQPNEAATVTFKNTYDETLGGGGSFVNNFKYTELENGETGWDVTRVSDNSTGSTVEKDFTGNK